MLPLTIHPVFHIYMYVILSSKTNYPPVIHLNTFGNDAVHYMKHLFGSFFHCGNVLFFALYTLPCGPWLVNSIHHSALPQ